MPSDRQQTRRGHRALDLMNFFIADVQTGFGPFVAVYLTEHKWPQVEIGFALSLGTVTSLLCQLPAGALVDAVQDRRGLTTGALLAVMLAALLMAVYPAEGPVYLAQILHAAASCLITPAIAAISLSLVGRAALGERLGRNARFASIGNGLAAAVMGVTGSTVSNRSVFILTAALCLPAIVALLAIPRGAPRIAAPRRQGLDWKGLRALFTDRRLVVFSVCIALFHLANAAMLPMAGSAVTMRAGELASVIIAACIVVPQAIVALLSPWVGRTAQRLGRRPVLMLGWAALPIRGLLLAVLPGAWLVIPAQAISGISAAVFGVMLPLLAADLTRGTGHFNLCMAALALPMFVGASISTALAGYVADAVSVPVAFVVLAMCGLAGTVLIWWAMPETRSAAKSVDHP